MTTHVSAVRSPHDLGLKKWIQPKGSRDASFLSLLRRFSAEDLQIECQCTLRITGEEAKTFGFNYFCLVFLEKAETELLQKSG